jgi:hypothetical protein
MAASPAPEMEKTLAGSPAEELTARFQGDPISPLGWSIATRLLFAAAAAALLWLAVAWALGR